MNDFLKDMDTGLNSQPKRLSSKYFYDDEGSRIFQEIMALPEYYLTKKEEEIFITRSQEIINALGPLKSIDVVELGAGDGSKTKLILQELLEQQIETKFLPIDISAEALESLEKTMRSHLPSLEVNSLVGDYHDVMDSLEEKAPPRLFLFLGSNIGNYPPPSNRDLIKFIASEMREGDFLMLGADLRKHPAVIKQAYDDSQGVTKRFNLNLLARMNRELEMNFDLEKWDFYCQYNPLDGELRSFLVSLDDQVVHCKALEKDYPFKKNEVIWTELSKKYLLSELEELGNFAELTLVAHFMDDEAYFTDTLFKKS
jgi:dimethylhistidine N-methyltransferase